MKTFILKSLSLVFALIIISCNNQSNKSALTDIAKLNDTSKVTGNIVSPFKKQKSNANFIELSKCEKKVRADDSKLKRVYCIYVENYRDNDADIWTDIVNTAYDKPYDATSVTIVFFFKDKIVPDISDGDITRILDVDTYNNTCVASYWHYPDGSEQMRKYPFKD